MATGSTPCGIAGPQDLIDRPVHRQHAHKFDEMGHLQQLAEEMVPPL
jgi:hypothetical protein